MNMKKIITTVGTSIFTNYQNDKVKARLGEDYASIDSPFNRVQTERDETGRKKEVPASRIYAQELESHIKSLKKIITDYWYEYPEVGTANRNVSAEIASILQIVEEEDQPCEVHLIATDTLLSVLAAELIVGWFERYPQPNVSKVLFQRQKETFEKQSDSDYVVKDLRVESHNDYEKGFFNLIELLNKLSKANKNGSHELIFNITGGYKALIPVMTLYAQLEHIPLKYLYESHEGKEDPLITLSNLPFHFDWGLLELLANSIENEKLRNVLPEDDPVLQLLRDYKIVKAETRHLTIIGEMVKHFVNDRLWEGKTSLGYFAEYKVFEALIEQLSELPKRGVEYWWDQQDKSRFSTEPQYNRDKDKELRIEFDLISEVNGRQIWYEVKPYSETGLNKACKQAKTKICFQTMALKAPLEKFRLVLYKFGFEEIKRNQQLMNLEQLFDQAGIAFEVWYFDVPARLDREKINNKSFFEEKVKLTKLE